MCTILPPNMFMFSSTLTLFKLSYTLFWIPPPCDHYGYSPNGSWSINNAYDIHASTKTIQGFFIAHGFVCIVHGSTHIVHNSIKMVDCSIYILHGSTLKMLIYHEFCLRFLAWFYHLANITHGSTTNAHGSTINAHGSINRVHGSTHNVNELV